MSGSALAQFDTQSIELGGQTSGWVGVAPEAIADETNPTLELQEGTTYELTWENLDGAPHNFVIESEDGEELERTEIMTAEGETQTLEFEATSDMATYFCEPHRPTMNGDISVSSGGGGGQGQQAAQQPQEGFFQAGTEIGLQPVAEGMTAPTDFAAEPGGDRYFVTDQTGELWAVTGDGLLDEPLLDISDRMVELGTFQGQYADPNQEYDERGLLGVDPHPDFAENGRLFLHYSAPPNDETPDGWSHVEVVSEFQASDDLSEIDPDSEQVIMEFQKPQYNHDAGPMAFGPDGYLYVPMGDGGGANDDMLGHVDDWYDENEGGNGQDVAENLLGSILRIDVDADGEGDRPYGIPDDNPLADADDARPEHYAWGFRNPYGISFDSDGRLFVADVGQDLFEEVDIVESGGNYGWNVKEGTHCFSTENPGDPPEDCPDSAPDEPPYDGQELQDPIVEYPHTYQDQIVGIAIVGGHVYEAGQVDGLEGKYIFGDWTSDPARQSPQGTLIAASEPQGDGGVTGGDQPGNATADNETLANESIEAGGFDDATNGTADNATADNESLADENIEAGGFDNATNESAGNATAGNETAADAGQEQVVPRDELWEMEELQVAGTDDGSFPFFVRQFGQDDEGNVYVLANQVGVPEGDTGVVFRIVPPGEGESLSPPEDVGDGQQADQQAENATETQDEPINETSNETETTDIDGNETGLNETDGNETELNETDGTVD
ncbi:hypothetical protein GCM10028856_31020 [Halopiger thermotolerans]